MKTLESRSSVQLTRKLIAGSVAILLLVILAACAQNQKLPEVTPALDTSASVTLTCDECELIDVIDVVDANTLLTSIGEIQLYGTYVLDQPADCAALAQERLRTLAADQVRIEYGPQETVRQDNDHYYLFTVDGQSIEERLIREGLALTWRQDGQHLGWFLFRDSSAKETESGCLWRDWQAFQRGEPNEFRIPGLTYPESQSE